MWGSYNIQIRVSIKLGCIPFSILPGSGSSTLDTLTRARLHSNVPVHFALLTCPYDHVYKINERNTLPNNVYKRSLPSEIELKFELWIILKELKMKFQQITVESFQRNTKWCCVEGEERKNVHDFVVMWREESIEAPDKILTVRGERSTLKNRFLVEDRHSIGY